MIEKATKLFNSFFNSEKMSGLLLFYCTFLSLIIVNTPFGQSYLGMWSSTILNIHGMQISLLSVINDGLMTIFFLIVGLEIEREIYIGELSKIKTALLPVVAAIGGSLLPPLIHYALNRNLPTQAGAGIPMATDIAFAIGVLSLAGNKIPVSLKVFLTALAILDDLFAIIVISFFYSTGISYIYLGAAFLVFVFLCVLNRWGVRSLVVYLLGGVCLWVLVHNSGVHATITGVLLAFAIPFRGGDRASSPSYRLQHALHKPVAFIIMPLFALANTGIELSYSLFGEVFTRNGLGIILGLCVGKVAGISLSILICNRLRIVHIPREWELSHIIGVGFLGGIGFTMSIFISILAFGAGTPITSASMIAIFTGSLISGICGYVILWMKGHDKNKTHIKIKYVVPR